MVYESKGLLIGEGLDAETLKIVRKKVDDDPADERVRALYTLYLGPHEVLLTIELRFHSHISALEVRQAVRRLRKDIQSCHPDIKRIFFGAESLTEDGNLSVNHHGETLTHDPLK